MNWLSVLPLLGVALLAAVGVLGDFFVKLASSRSNFLTSGAFYTGLVLYALTAFGWVMVMKYVKLSTLGVIYSITTAFLLILVGTLYFNEKLQMHEVFGIALGIISLILLSNYK